jgi:hypothetical protein
MVTGSSSPPVRLLKNSQPLRANEQQTTSTIIRPIKNNLDFAIFIPPKPELFAAPYILVIKIYNTKLRAVFAHNVVYDIIAEIKKNSLNERPKNNWPFGYKN